MATGPRFERGLPRGGLGFASAALAVAAGLITLRLRGAAGLAVALAVWPWVVWLALGLRADGEAGEMADLVIDESPHRHDWFRVRDNIVTIFRISTASILVATASALWAAWIWWSGQEGFMKS